MVSTSDPAIIAKWDAEIARAQEERVRDVKAMDRFDVRVTRGRCSGFSSVIILTTSPAPSRADIQLSREEMEVQQGFPEGTVAWVTQGLKLQEAQ